jgi:diguanylate cyclase (GGDEF)-like protein
VDLRASPEEELRRVREKLESERAARREAEQVSESVMSHLYAKHAELELLQSVATASNEASTVEEAMQVAVKRVCAHTGWPVGHVYLVEEHSPEAAVSTSVWYLEDPDRFEAFRSETEATCFHAGMGLPGRVLAEGSSAWTSDLTRNPNLPRARVAAEVGLNAAFAFPVLVSGRVAAVLEFFAPAARGPDEALQRLMSYVGEQLGRVIERERGREELARQALHDSLTGLANRRSLFADLDQRLPTASPGQPLLIVLCDLDGFKAYNDTFGHAAGDALLARLAHNLSGAMAGRGTAYRMGGDEFCVLASLSLGDHDAISKAAVEALSERGEGFSVSASYGAVLLPGEASTSVQALRTADQRMYANKALGSRASAGRQTTDVLLRVLCERNPDLGIHLDEVTQLCQEVAVKLGLPEDEIVPILQAASLHDVGKAAIPDEILNKPGPLDDEEWEFMRRHTLIGERILSAAPALARAAVFVRSSHERYDGKGYPDGLIGEEIPLGARVIAVCDSFDAMTSDRPYRESIGVEAAVAELRRCAGTQFDPAVIDAFHAVIADRELLAIGPSEW